MLNRRLTDTPIIFLDFDGVLNHIGCNPETDFLSESIDVLNNIHKEFNTKIILSTSWKEAYIFMDLVNLLSEKGIKAPVIDKTPSYIQDETAEKPKELSGRNAEILSCIRRHDIRCYVILDDCPLDNPELKKHQVTPCYFDEQHGGLRKEHEPLIRKILML